MAHSNSAMDRTGHDQNFRTRVAAQINFCKRVCMGFIAQNHIHHNQMWMERNPEYKTDITPERRAQLKVILQKVDLAQLATKEVVAAIEHYYTLPTTEQPKRARQRVARTRQVASKGDENFQEG